MIWRAKASLTGKTTAKLCSIKILPHKSSINEQKLSPQIISSWILPVSLPCLFLTRWSSQCRLVTLCCSEPSTTSSSPSIFNLNHSWLGVMRCFPSTPFQPLCFHTKNPSSEDVWSEIKTLFAHYYCLLYFCVTRCVFHGAQWDEAKAEWK